MLYVLTFFGGTRALAALSKALADNGANIETITSLAHRGGRGLEMVVNVRGAESLPKLKNSIIAAAHELGVDTAFQKIESYRKNKRLIFFDMDCTLIDMEVIDELAKAAGAEQEVARITAKAMAGELDFEESLVQRVAMLKGPERGGNDPHPRQHALIRRCGQDGRHAQGPGLQAGRGHRRVRLLRPDAQGTARFRLRLCQPPGNQGRPGDRAAGRRHHRRRQPRLAF